MTMTKFEKYICYIFVSLFLFSMFNRELAIFGLDLRIFVGLFGIVLAITNLINKRKLALGKIEPLLTSFFALTIVSNIAWLWNGLDMNYEAFSVVFVACVYNFFVFLLISSNRDIIRWSVVGKIILVSAVVLLASMLASYFGIDLRQFGSAYPGGYIDKLAPSLINDTRYGGYAQDPNYATLLLIVAMAVVVYNFARNKNSWVLLFLPFAIFGVLLSASKAMLIMAPIALSILIIKNRRISQIIKMTILGAMILATLVLAIFNIKVGDIQTINTRVSLWHSAIDSFWKSPVIGSGATAARSSAAVEKWYVQPHSSVIQTVVDFGIVGLILITLLLRRNLLSRNKLVVFLTLVFLAHFATHETIYQSYFVFLIALLPLFLKSDTRRSRQKTATVFVINTLSNGGAERIVQVMANNSHAKDKVVIYTLYDSGVEAYELHENIDVISLGGSGSKRELPKLVSRLNYELDKLCESHEVRLATAHLPFAQLVVRLSRYHDEFMYVMHGMYGVADDWKTKLMVRWMYNGHQIISVSKGLEAGDVRAKFGIKSETMKTIYNPLDVSFVDEKLKDKALDVSEKYILTVGRLSPPKNPKGAIDAYYKSGLSQTHKLVMLGDGELRGETERRIAQYGLENRVELKGFQKNPLAYMKGAEFLLLTSDYEAFATVIAEAFYANCPVVAYDIKYGVDEVMNGKFAAYIAQKGDIDDMARVMKSATHRYPTGLREHVLTMVEPVAVMKQYYDTYREWSL